MKIIKYTYSLLIALLVVSCANDDLIDLAVISGPTDISANFTITQDNSGLVTITPSAQSASLFEIYYGDGSDEHITLSVGESTEQDICGRYIRCSYSCHKS